VYPALRFCAVANAWNAVNTLPGELDLAQAEVYREAEGVEHPLGGRWLVWPDAVWWERPDGRFQPSIFRREELAGVRWERVEA